jgi:hypothetical protein
MSEADAMNDAMTGQVSPEAAELYERFFVPALSTSGRANCSISPV